MPIYNPKAHAATAYRRPPMRVMTSVESVRQVVAEGQNFKHCGWCGFTTPDVRNAPQHICPIAQRIAAAKRQAAAEGRATVPHFGPLPGAPVKCIDCGKVTPAGTAHSCPGPKTSAGAHDVEHQMRRAALVNDLKALGVIAPEST